MANRKVAVCLFNRASYSRIKYLLKHWEFNNSFDFKIYIAGSISEKSYGSCHQSIEELFSHRVVNLGPLGEGGTGYNACQISSKILDLYSKAFEKDKPDGVMVFADRFETLPAAMAASYQNIPLFHVQGGEITGNLDDRIRHSVSKLSDYHFTSTVRAKNYLLELGEEYNRICHSGCPSLDFLKKNNFNRLVNKIEKEIIVIFHPETENISEASQQTAVVLESVMDFAALHQIKVRWYYPNPDPGRNEIIKQLDHVKLFDKYFEKAVNEDSVEFLRRLNKCVMIIGNSSCGIREAGYLGVPAINIGERQRFRERCRNIMDVGYNVQEITKAMKDQFQVKKYPHSFKYGKGLASHNITRFMENIPWSIKGSITYPRKLKFFADHFDQEEMAVKIKKGKNKRDDSVIYT